MEDSKGFFCSECNVKYFPSQRWNYYWGYDTIRFSSILDNYKAHFIYRQENGTMLERHNALEKIMEHGYKRNISKYISVKWPFESGLKQYSIRGFMMEEGNNCSFVSKYIKNVIIRWNCEVQPMRFMALWSMDPKDLEKEDPDDETMSEIIVEDQSKFERPIRILVKQDWLLNKLQQLTKQGDKWITAKHHPVMVFKRIFKRSENYFNNFTIGFLRQPQHNIEIQYHEQILMSNINAIHLKPSSNIFEFSDRYCQYYQTCVESDLGGLTEHSIYTIYEYLVSWAKE